MYKAWKLYGNPQAIVLIVHEFREKNIFDQRAVEYELLRKGVRCERTIFNGLHKKLKLSTERVLTYNEFEIAMVYLRAGFSISHYDA